MAGELPAPSEGENLIADYRSLGLTLRRHPLTLLRQRLTERCFVTAAALKTAGHRALIRAAGIVVGRQRPGTATGIVFVTLEDETGLANIVVHPQLVDKQRRELLGSSLLGARPDFDTSEAQFWLPSSSGAGFRASSCQNPRYMDCCFS